MEVCMGQPEDMLDDEDYPAFTMGRAAEIIGCSPDFLRRLGDAKLIDPFRSGGGHRRYSRYQIRLAARAREMCDQGTDLDRPAASSSSRTNSKKRCATTKHTPRPDRPASTTSPGCSWA
jgi:DNA-binding transcriptional MerR regulator